MVVVVVVVLCSVLAEREGGEAETGQREGNHRCAEGNTDGSVVTLSSYATAISGRK